MTSAPDTGLAASPAAARVYDTLIGSRLYNRLAWATDPAEYTAFAAEAVASGTGPLLEIAAGPANATLPLYVAANRAVTVSDASPAMLRRSTNRARRLWPEKALASITWAEADMWNLPREPRYTTILGLGLLHMIDDIPALVDSLRGRCLPGGEIWLSGLFAGNRRAALYLRALHRSGEIAAPRTATDLHRALPEIADIRSRGCMAYARIPA